VPVLAAGAAALAASAGLGYLVWRARRASASARAARPVRLRLLFGSTTGSSEKWARHTEAELQKHLQLAGAQAEVHIENLETFDFDSILEKGVGQCADIVVVMLSTHSEGLPPPSCSHFCTLLDDHVHDFRVGKTALSHLNFAVLGFGSSDYEEAGHFCTAAMQVDAGFAALSARRLLPVGRVSDTRDADSQVTPWLERLSELVMRLSQGLEVEHDPTGNAEDLGLGDGDYSDGESASTSVGSDASQDRGADPADLEDLHEDGCATGGASKGKKEVREMVTKQHREQLTKEGYKIIGTHSAVKLCRWTKHQLRGRGGCYKHTFYGITSYECMEATPSLACANKCTFCWRHHKNPTGTEWKWKMDDPLEIVAEGVELHRKMIRECKGIPGVKPDRLEAAMTIKHCALSLVGEPIMYPRINELVDELHRRKISTFLVTNAQFPEAIENLRPITQLYVSVDAGTKESLKAVDRPIFTDFWDRYLSSLKALEQKQQRTVYRLTLVKDQNMSDIPGYAKLVALGKPDFIEIKSVTFCGESKASTLTMGNVPWHEEVKVFGEKMLSYENLDSEYELACEHQHSCIILLANKRFKIDGKWHTWIDYDKFHGLVEKGERAGLGFAAMDYSAPTPDWALYGSQEKGFDPQEKRVFHNRTKRRAKEGKLSEEQLRMYPSNPADS